MRNMTTQFAHTALTGFMIVALIDAAWAQQGPPRRIRPDYYIVVFKDAVVDVPGVAAQMTVIHGIDVKRIYGTALKGFAGMIRAAASRPSSTTREWPMFSPTRSSKCKVGSMPSVRSVRPEASPRAAAVRASRPASSWSTPAPPSHAASQCQRRRHRYRHPAESPDLNVGTPLGGVNYNGCRSDRWDDGHGHGTHVSGTIAALNNGIGVVGVAPGAGLYAVKVLDDQGNGYTSDVVAGINWVARRGNADPARTSGSPT